MSGAERPAGNRKHGLSVLLRTRDQSAGMTAQPSGNEPCDLGEQHPGLGLGSPPSFPPPQATAHICAHLHGRSAGPFPATSSGRRVSSEPVDAPSLM